MPTLIAVLAVPTLIAGLSSSARTGRNHVEPKLKARKLPGELLRRETDESGGGGLAEQHAR